MKVRDAFATAVRERQLDRCRKENLDVFLKLVG